MDNEKYLKIFNAFENAPLEDFLKGVFRDVSVEQRKSLVLEDVSYHRLSADVVTLEAWMCVEPIESNQWIWVRVEMDRASGEILEYFFTRDSYRKQSLTSLQACVDYYKEEKQ